MKILIVDDDPLKARRLADVVTAVAPDVEVLYANNAADGFRTLMTSAAHLVLLDVVLPLNLGDAPSEEGSLWFVREVKRKLLGAPQPFIVGTTQYVESIAKVQETFRNVLWNVVHIHDTDTAWKSQIQNALNYAASNAERLSFNGGVKSNEVDVAIVTALRNPEFSELVNALGGGRRISLAETQESWLRCDLQKANGESVRVLAASADEMGMTAMASLVTRLCISSRPRRLILVGIMAGNRQRVQMSDLIIVDSTWNFEVGKLTENGFQPDLKTLPSSFSISNGLTSVLTEDFVLRFWQNWKSSERPQQIAKVHKADVACSPYVVADGKTFERLEEGQKRKVYGLEMEAFGLYDAARRLGALAPEVVCVKSVCDFGDGTKNDQYQTYCAALAAAAVVHFVLH